MSCIRPNVLLLLATFTVSAPTQLTWTQITTTSSASPRYGHAMAYHAALGQIVLFGGANDMVNTLDDTWEFDGLTWRMMNPATRPPARRWHTMVYDPGRAAVILYGGDIQSAAGPANDTWLYTLDRRWVQLTTARTPVGRDAHAATFHVANGTMVVFGGYRGTVATQETWTLDRTNTWQLASGIAPAARINAAMVYDSHRQVTVLTGGAQGTTAISDTWEWNGSWRNVGVPGPAVQQTAIAYDEVRRRVVIFGGLTGLAPTNLHAEFDGRVWDYRFYARPSSRTSPRAVFVPEAALPRQGAMYVFGGSRFPGALGDTWRLNAVIPARADVSAPACAAGRPSLTPLAPNDRPWINSLFTLRLSDLTTNTLAGLFFGASNRSWLGIPLPLDVTPAGITNCRLLVSGDVLFNVPASGSTGDVTISVPSAGELLGLPFYAQGFSFSPGANPTGILLSNAATMIIGSR